MLILKQFNLCFLNIYFFKWNVVNSSAVMFRQHIWPVAPDPDVVIVGGVAVVAAAAAVPACLTMNRIRESLPMVNMNLRSIS